MVEAAVAMRDSSKGSIGELEIVHRDLKPGNGKTFHIEVFNRRDND